MAEAYIDSIPFDLGGTTKFFDTVDTMGEEYGPPSSLAGVPAHTPFFDSLTDLPSPTGEESVDDDPRLKEVHKKIADWLTTYHGPEPESANTLRSQVQRGKISGSDYYAMTGRIYAGGGQAGDGLSTGTMSTGGLDALDASQSQTRGDTAPSGGGDAFAGGLGHTSLPGSVAARVGPPSPGMVRAGSTFGYTFAPPPLPVGTGNKTTRVFQPVTPGTGNQIQKMTPGYNIWG